MRKKSKPKIKEIVANRLIIGSRDGKSFGCFEARESGVSLDLHGAGSTLSLCIDTDGNPKINFSNKNNRAAISMGVSDEMGHGITLHDSMGCPVCFIRVPKDGVPRIDLFKVGSFKNTKHGKVGKGKKIWGTPVSSAPAVKKKKAKIARAAKA